MSEFSDAPATVEAVHLLIGIVAPSGAGKTFSAQELATGITRVDPGPVFVVDSNNRRSTRYADRFPFRLVDFQPPYTPQRYQAAAEYCVSRGAKVVIFDSASDLWDGIGGALDMHDRLVKELAAKWKKSEEAVNASAWIEPKSLLSKFRHAVTHMDAHFIFCYRAQEKTDFKKGGKPQELGWLAVGDPKMIFELEIKFLLMPGADGVPTLIPDMIEERKLVKTPIYFRELFKTPQRLSADIGEKMARWAVSGDAPQKQHPLLAKYIACADAAAFERLESERAKAWPSLTVAEKDPLKKASEAAKARLTSEQPATDPGAQQQLVGSTDQHEDQPPPEEWTREQHLAFDQQLAQQQAVDDGR